MSLLRMLRRNRKFSNEHGEASCKSNPMVYRFDSLLMILQCMYTNVNDLKQSIVSVKEWENISRQL
jgi:hypothetical protein